MAYLDGDGMKERMRKVQDQLTVINVLCFCLVVVSSSFALLRFLLCLKLEILNSQPPTHQMFVLSVLCIVDALAVEMPSCPKSKLPVVACHLLLTVGSDRRMPIISIGSTDRMSSACEASTCLTQYASHSGLAAATAMYFLLVCFNVSLVVTGGDDFATKEKAVQSSS